jgi:hypothetical protein
VFVRLKGRNGNVREYPAVLSPAFEFCAIPKVDAFALGYQEAAVANGAYSEHFPNAVHYVNSGSYGMGALIRMDQVDIGAMSLRNVEFLTYDILQATGVDVVLGRSLLQEMRLEVDFVSSEFKLEMM